MTEEREPVFHIFPRHAKTWLGVFPGDVVISPATPMIKYGDYTTDSSASRIIVVQNKPLIVISVIPGVMPSQVHEISDELRTYIPFQTRNEGPETFATFVVYSVTMGVLVCLKSTVDNGVG